MRLDSGCTLSEEKNTNNFDLDDDKNANMIEEKAVMKLMEEGSNQIMTDYIGELILEFSMIDFEGDYEE